MMHPERRRPAAVGLATLSALGAPDSAAAPHGAAVSSRAGGR
jgi:hypothetical protein